MRIRLIAASALILLIGSSASAEPVDTRAIFNQNKRATVRIVVTGRDANGQQTLKHSGSGVLVRSSGTIVTSKSLVGRDQDWFQAGGLPERNIEVFASDDHGISRSMGRASAKTVPYSEVAILQISGENFPFANISEEQVDALSSIVSIIWEPDAGAPEPVTGDLVPTDAGRFGDVLVVRASLIDGWEGAGVYGAAGRLIGVITKQIDRPRAVAEKVYAWLPLLPPVPNIRPQESDLAACEAKERERKVERQPFSIANSVRCENMGDSQSGKVAYEAPPNFTIVGQVSKADEVNYGTVGPIAYEKQGNRVESAKVDLSCKTPSRPFGPGGWAGSTLTGFIERMLSESDLAQIRQGCLKAR